MPLPVPDEEVKNFSVTKIAETRTGFEVAVNWGGGNSIYDVAFFFVFKDARFFLDKVSTSRYGADTRSNRTTKKIDPPVPIDKVKIAKYLQ